MQEIMELGLKNIVASVIFCELSFIAILFLLINIIKGDFNKTCLKIFGSLLLVGVMLVANNIFVYSVTPLIIGTLVTDPAFIERITALLSKNKEYFKTATDEEHKEKIENEIIEDYPMIAFDIENIKSNKNLNTEGSTYKKRIENELEFEKLVLEKLKLERDLIPAEYIKYNLGLYDTKGKKTLFDALVSIPSGYYYVIEIKNADSLHSLNNSINQLKEYSNRLKRYFKKNHLQFNNIKNMLIIPDNKELTDNIYDDFAVLKYNIGNNEFVNKEKIFNWLKGN